MQESRELFVIILDSFDTYSFLKPSITLPILVLRALPRNAMVAIIRGIAFF